MLEIISVPNDSIITIFGATFNGVDSIIEYALNGESNCGVYVGQSCQRYPCFDSFDYECENRYFWNFVFAKSKDEITDKTNMLRNLPYTGSFRKLNEDTPEEMRPMIYFNGDKRDPLDITVCEEITVTAPPPAPPAPVIVWTKKKKKRKKK